MTNKDIADRFTEAIGLTEPPVAVYYSDSKPEDASEWCPKDKTPHFCHVAWMRSVRKGKPAVVSGEATGCMGATRYLGYSDTIREGFEYFLSHDDQGHGERFKKTPELVRDLMGSLRHIPAKGKYCVFQRLDQTPDDTDIEGVVFFVEPDQLAGMVFLAQYDNNEPDAVTVPFASACGSMVYQMRLQALKDRPGIVLGLLDPTARPMVGKNLLTLAVPKKRLLEMYENIPGSFLEIEPWLSVKKR